MNKVVVVPQNAKVVFAQNENKGTFFAGVLVKVTACMVKKLYAVMGEVPAREALDALTARNEEEAETAESAGNVENAFLPAAESVPAVNAIEAPAKAEETETAAEAEAEVKSLPWLKLLPEKQNLRLKNCCVQACLKPAQRRTDEPWH